MIWALVGIGVFILIGVGIGRMQKYSKVADEIQEQKAQAAYDRVKAIQAEKAAKKEAKQNLKA